MCHPVCLPAIRCNLARRVATDRSGRVRVTRESDPDSDRLAGPVRSSDVWRSVLAFAAGPR
jgi:hypothetical protein